MSQEQPRRPQGNQEGIKYGYVFDVSGELASKKIAPRHAAAMQAAETAVRGQIQWGDPAAVMQSAADVNENLGVVGHYEANDITRDQGVTVSEAVVGGRRVVTEAVGPEVIGGYATTTEAGGGRSQVKSPSPAVVGGGITIGEALEATAVAAGDKPVDASDAAAIQAAEVRATGRGQVMPGGIGAEAQSAVNLNPQIASDQDKTKLGYVLTEATDRLPDDKPVTREDAQRAVAAEIRNDPRGCSHPVGVAASLVTSARLNEGPTTP